MLLLQWTLTSDDWQTDDLFMFLAVFHAQCSNPPSTATMTSITITLWLSLSLHNHYHFTITNTSLSFSLSLSLSPSLSLSLSLSLPSLCAYIPAHSVYLTWLICSPFFTFSSGFFATIACFSNKKQVPFYETIYAHCPAETNVIPGLC